ncbi:hypothetical protein [Aureibacillus halotolerans]|uniref:hypothetical protein n=1 Tax=Aureibacillus halotolerans TaxID=1508390 RepID=UPI00105F25D9|nr:hypothetical protein [Aureibacillus halotolerans]
MSAKPFNRTRAYYRHHRQRVIQRKRKIVKKTEWHVKDNQFGRLHKGKIHCSCGMCTMKTHNLGFPWSEQKLIEGMKQEIRDFYRGLL